MPPLFYLLIDGRHAHANAYRYGLIFHAELNGVSAVQSAVSVNMAESLYRVLTIMDTIFFAIGFSDQVRYYKHARNVVNRLDEVDIFL